MEQQSLDLSVSYQDGKAAEYLCSSKWNLDNPKPFRSIICQQGGKDVAALRLYDVSIMLKEIKIVCAGIGCVWVHEKCRGKGLGFEFMQSSVELLQQTMTKDGRVALLLFSRERTLYRDCGFFQIQKASGEEYLWCKVLSPGIEISWEGDSWVILGPEHF